jgi:site-specific recombinase XerD
MNELCPDSVNKLCDVFQTWADSYYLGPTGKPTRESSNLRDAMRALRAVAGDIDPQDLSADHLQAAQTWMVKQGMSRTTVNTRCNRLRRMAKWAVKPPRRWLPPEIMVEWSLVDPLRKWRTEAAESMGVKPVQWEDVCAVMAHANLQLATMLEIHWLTGMRPSELTNMRRSWLHPRDHANTYEPIWHKTAHHGHKRIILIGPQASTVLIPWLRRIKATQDRLWTITSSQVYAQAIHRVQIRHRLSSWNPNQIRHSFATRMRAKHGMDATQIALGHKHITTTEIYAEPDMKSAISAINKMG